MCICCELSVFCSFSGISSIFPPISSTSDIILSKSKSSSVYDVLVYSEVCDLSRYKSLFSAEFDSLPIKRDMSSMLSSSSVSV